MKVSIFIFLSLFICIKLNNQINYSINNFLNFLQTSGFYDFLSYVKQKLGSDVAIDLCKIFLDDHPLCEDVVRVYISNSDSPNSRRIPAKKEEINIMDIILKFESILKGIFTEFELVMIKYKISKKYKIFDKKKEKLRLIEKEQAF